jgi:F-type H+-transporting ATPase subunit delta
VNVDGVARRYAQALLGAVPPAERGEADEQLARVAAALGEDPVAAVWRHPGVPMVQKRAALRRIFADEPWALKLAEVLMSHGREDVFGEVAGAFHRERLAAAGRVAVAVRTARPLSDAWRARIVEAMARRLHGPVDASFEVEPSLLGGVEVRFRDELMDATVRGRLNRLRRVLKDGTVTS